jgi:hypothetical protein
VGKGERAGLVAVWIASSANMNWFSLHLGYRSV